MLTTVFLYYIELFSVFQGSITVLGRVVGRMLQAHPNNTSKFHQGTLPLEELSEDLSSGS